MPELITPKVGRYVKPDLWKVGENLIGSDWDKAQFRIPAGRGMYQLAVNITVTGRTMQMVNGGLAVRVKITFVGDDEPDQTTGGWMWRGEEMDGEEVDQARLLVMLAERDRALERLNPNSMKFTFKDYRGLDLRGIDFSGLNLMSSDFRGARIDGSTRFDRCNLAYCDFRWTNFGQASQTAAEFLSTRTK